MKQTTVAFTRAPRPSAHAPENRSASIRHYEQLGAQFDAVVRSLVADDAAIAAIEARRSRHFAEAAALAEAMAVADGSIEAPSGRE